MEFSIGRLKLVWEGCWQTENLLCDFYYSFNELREEGKVTNRSVIREIILSTVRARFLKKGMFWTDLEKPQKQEKDW